MLWQPKGLRHFTLVRMPWKIMYYGAFNCCDTFSVWGRDVEAIARTHTIHFEEIAILIWFRFFFHTIIITFVYSFLE